MCASVALVAAGAELKVSPAGQAWTDSPYRNFHASTAILGGAVLVADEASDSSLAGALARDLQALRGELHENGGWRNPFTEDEPLRVYVARKDAGGVRRLSVRSVDRGTLLGASIQIDGTGMTEDEIVREAARFYALATLTAYGAPDGSFLTSAVADYLSAGVRPQQDREDALLAAAAPGLDLAAQADALGRFYVDEFARATVGSWELRAIWEKSAETGQPVLPLFLEAYTRATGDGADRLLLLFAARLYSSLEPEAGPSRIGLLDLQTGALDASAPVSFVVRHRAYVPGAESPAAFLVSWPETGAPAAAVLRYRDGAIPPDVVFFSPGESRPIPLAGVARLDWLVAGSAGGSVPAAPAAVETLAGYPYSGLSAHASAGEDGPRVWWSTSSHQSLAGWAIFREEVLPDGRVARTGPEILPASDQGGEPLRYVFVDPAASAGTYYRYTVWAVTDEGTLSRAFAATLRTAD
ncbi:MAG TPA: hypothetical protein VKH43_03410 [Thermoanaerobaculia bacterium]|nr:hypothetical protein [Thermoanaerobaculia bacterium]